MPIWCTWWWNHRKQFQCYHGAVCQFDDAVSEPDRAAWSVWMEGTREICGEACMGWVLVLLAVRGIRRRDMDPIVAAAGRR